MSKTINLLVFCQLCQKFLRELYLHRCLIFSNSILSKHQCCFQKGYSTQQCLLSLLKKWKYVFDEGKGFGALLTDFSEVLDSLDYELLIEKLYADGYSLPELKLVHDYLSHIT